MRRILIHVAAFCLTLFALWMLLTLAAAIPNEALVNNFEKSAVGYGSTDAFNFERAGYLNSVSDNYADCILLSVSYYMGESKAHIAALSADYYRGEADGIGVNEAFLKSVTEGAVPDTDYSRYWHGMAAFVRVIHLFGDVECVKLFGFIAFAVMLALTLCMLALRKSYKSALALALAILCVQPWNLLLSMEYQPPFVICFLLCPLYLFFERRNEKVLTVLSVIGGTLTAFFDFLSCETVAILLPVMLVIAVRTEEKRFSSFKKEATLAFFSLVAFFAAFAFTFLAKWVLASLFTGENKLMAAFSSASLHVSSGVGYDVPKNDILRIILAPLANLTVLFYCTSRLDIARVMLSLALVTFVLGSVFYLFNKKKKGYGAEALMLLLGTVVILRYAVLSHHSYMHEFFTYRALVSAVFAVLASTLLCLEFKRGGRKK